MRLFLSAFLASILVAAAFLLFSVYFQNVKPDDRDQIAEDASPSVSLERPREDSETQSMGSDVVVDFEGDGRFKEMHCPIASEEVERIRNGESDWRVRLSESELVDEHFLFQRLRIQTDRPAKSVSDTTIVLGNLAICEYRELIYDAGPSERLQLALSGDDKEILLPEEFTIGWQTTSGAHFDYLICSSSQEGCRFLVGK